MVINDYSLALIGRGFSFPSWGDVPRKTQTNQDTQAKATTSTRRGPLLSDESSRYARKEENSYHSSCSLLRAWNNITHTHTHTNSSYSFFFFFLGGGFLEETLEKLESTKLLLTTVSTYKSKKNSCVFVVCVFDVPNHLERNGEKFGIDWSNPRKNLVSLIRSIIIRSWVYLHTYTL